MNAANAKIFKIVIASLILVSAACLSVEAQVPPDPPTNIAVAVHNNTSLRVTWSPPANTGSGQINFYIIRVRDPAENTVFSRDYRAPLSTATVGPFKTSTTYTVVMLARNDGGGGWSAESAPVSITTNAAPAATPPSAPTNVTLTSDGPRTLQVSWEAPASDGNSPITGYTIRFKQGDGPFTSRSGSDVSSPYTFSSLALNTVYTVRIFATNEAGFHGAQSDPVMKTTGSTATKPGPGRTPNVQGVSNSATSLRVTWSKVASGGSPITDYDVQYRVKGAAGYTDSPYTTTTPTANLHSTTIMGLTRGTTYQVRVRAKNSIGNGDWSTVPGEGTTSDAPSVPQPPTVVAVSDTSLRVTWTAPNDNGSAITDYDVEYRVQGTGNYQDWSHTGTGRTATITGLTHSTTYQVHVRAKNSLGNSVWSVPGSGTTNAPPRLNTPTIDYVSEKNESLNLSWTNGADVGLTIHSYSFYYRVKGSTAWNTQSLTQAELNRRNSGVTTWDIFNLASGTTYQVRVQTRHETDSARHSERSAVAEGTTYPVISTAPTVTAPTATSLNVTWTPPTTGGGATVSDYDVRYRVNGSSGRWTNWSHTGTSTTATITGLPNTNYEVQVRASISGRETYQRSISDKTIISLVWSPSGAVGGTITPPPSLTVPAKPNTPTVTPIQGDLTRLNVRWTAPNNGGAPITGYAVQYRIQNTQNIIDWPHSGTGTTTIITNLTPNTTYQVRVRATNSQGDSPWSDWGTGTTTVVTPPPPPPHRRSTHRMHRLPRQ